jgi:maltose O-acetyltransferase
MSFKSFVRRTNLHIVNSLPVCKFFGFKRFLLNRIPGVSLGKGTRVVGKLILSSCSLKTGANCYINREVAFYGNGLVSFGDNVDIGPAATFLTGGHIVGNTEHRAGSGITDNIFVGNGCWIGAKSTIMTKKGGITVSNGCVVGACALVISDTESNGLYVGVPATLKKKYDN